MNETTELELFRDNLVSYKHIPFDDPVRKIVWPDPTPEMLESKEFKAIWNCIKSWDINVPYLDGDLYSGATGNHVRAILDALNTG